MWQEEEAQCGLVLVANNLMTDKTLIKYIELRKLFTKQEILDMVFVGIIKPIEKTNDIRSWKFKHSDVGQHLREALNTIKLMEQEGVENVLLADEIEHEWSKTDKSLRGNKK